ncbi:CU044_5270 family protein [Actinoallomurus rhizosphaericola]|uniref:CU044_5270 family protein n=1 Tax=Actinoallomurus rhizosphaericola TaxID=2952536 RepID=UPI0020901683|nr:CU044_5270 family protein [Actinoallomurus rhizosphaericola]MCO5994500.1 CU044_5270 family protein [Actinoallomurus rhizosphaericola]
MNHDTDAMFRTLKPAGLDTTVAEAHARRREQDLAAAWDATGSGRGVSAPAARRRMPRVLVAGLAAGAVAASAAFVIAATDGSGNSPGARPTASGTVRALDARAILLASADSAAKAPLTTGAYWYTRERETHFVAPMKLTEAQQKEVDRKLGTRLKGKTKADKSSPVTAWVSHTQESWSGRDRHARTIVGIDPKIKFASPADEAKWRTLSESQRARLQLDVPAEPHVNNYDFSHAKLLKTDEEKQVSALAKLPSDPAGLEKTLRKWYQDERALEMSLDGRTSENSFAAYVFGEAQDLLAGPLTPGAKAALYRVLAEQPGIRYLGTATDSMGRKGAVLALGTNGDDTGPIGKNFEIRLIVDPRSGRLLAQESGDRKAPSLTMTYEAMGWVNSLGARP